MTNKHVCDPRRAIFNEFHLRAFEYSPPQFIKIAGHRRQILAIDYNHDLCILETEMTKKPFDLSTSYTIGEEIHLIGHPRGLPLIVRKGRIISRGMGIYPWLVHRTQVPYLMISSTTYPGNSGSPVLNKYGNLIGVLFAGRRGIHTEALVVPLDSVRQFLERI
jgi:S1-C subfamily serine protease